MLKMQSVIQKKSYGSVKTFWLNKELLNEKIKQAIKRMLTEKSEIEDVVLFGSFAENKATVSSDVDILLVLKSSDKNFIDRQLDYRDYFSDIDLNVDIFAYTQGEVSKGNPFVEKALSKGLHFSLDRLS
jgi:predicted nucleotidyltransferase